MESLIETFHIDIRLLLAQIINFAIIFSVLYFFALKPLAKIMQERTNKIEKSLEDAKQIEEALKNAKAEYEKTLAEARSEANAIMERANTSAEERKTDMINKAKDEIGAIINVEKAKMQTEKAETLREIRAEVAELITASMEKVLGEKIDNKKDHELIEKSIK